MSRWGTNSGLLFLSFLMAVGIVWIKGQDRLDSRTLRGIPVSIEGLPSNLVLPDPWTPPTVSVKLLGPRNVIMDFIRPDQCRFFIPFSWKELPEDNTPQTVILNQTMFRTGLVDESDRARISVEEETIQPIKASIVILPWDVTQERPRYDNLITPDSATIPLYRIQKKVPIIAPTMSEPPNGLKLKEILIDPPEIQVTGPREAVDRIQAVSTAFLDLSYVSQQTPPQFMALPDLEEVFSVWPVAKTIRGVTVTLKLTR